MTRTFIQRAVLVLACIPVVGCASPTAPSPQLVSLPIVSAPALSELFVRQPREQPSLETCGFQAIDARPSAPLHVVLSETLRSLVDVSAKAGVSHFAFDVEAMDGGSHLTGELVRANGNPQYADMAMHTHMLLEPGSLDFDSPQAFVRALVRAVDFAAVITIDGGPEIRTCKPAGVITGRIAAHYEPPGQS